MGIDLVNCAHAQKKGVSAVPGRSIGGTQDLLGGTSHFGRNIPGRFPNTGYQECSITVHVQNSSWRRAAPPASRPALFVIASDSLPTKSPAIPILHASCKFSSGFRAHVFLQYVHVRWCGTTSGSMTTPWIPRVPVCWPVALDVCGSGQPASFS